MRISALSTIKKSHTILFMGQSNCAGFDHEAPADPATYPPQPGQFCFEPVTQTWQQLQQNKNNSGSFDGPFIGWRGSEMKLMNLLWQYYGADQYMIKYAMGGTSLSINTADQYNWSEKSTKQFCFKGSVLNYHAAMNSFPGVKIFPKVFIWWQGENDADPVNSAAYATNFNNFIAALKNQYALPDLRVIQVGLSNNQTGFSSDGRIAVNAAKINYAITGHKFISTDGAEVQPGGVHFSSVGYDDIAQRIFNVLITML